MTTSDPGDERLIALTEEALDRISSGETVDPRELCRDCPELADALAEVLEMSGALPELHRAAHDVDPLAGKSLAGRYLLQSCIGRGAMGMVYFAQDTELDRAVAVKLLDERLFHDPNARERFQREARAMAAIQHPNVVSVFDRGETEDGIQFLVMERLEGASLSQLLQDIQMSGDSRRPLRDVLGEEDDEAWSRRCARWAQRVAEGLTVAHAAGLVHRDVKPSNTFLTSSGRVVLLDFGIASIADQQGLTATDTAIGTPAYMAPEQLRSGPGLEASPTLDVYGLGATLYHLLTGHLPYEGQPAQVLAQIQLEDPAPVLERRPDLPRDLAAIVERCMERRPQDRYPTTAALAEDLHAFLDHRPVTARPIRAWRRVLRRWRRAPAKPLAAAGALVLAASLWWSLPMFFDLQSRDIAAEKAERYRRLPALLAIDCWPNERVLSSLTDEHEAALAQLDELLELDPSDLPLRLWRGCLLLDLDRRGEASEAFRALAQEEGSPYVSALAERYRLGDPALVGAEAVETNDLPAPTDARELYIAGFHELRNRHIRGYARRAYELLSRAAPDYLPARDLRLLAIAALAERSGRDEQQRLVQELYDESVALEEAYRGPTARTLVMRGVARLFRGEYADAVPPLLQALELRPDRQSPHHNLGIAYRRLGDLEASERHLEAARRLHPFAWHTKYTLVQVVCDRGRYEEAHALLDEVPTKGPAGNEAARVARLRGHISLEQANLYEVTDPERAELCAERAAAAFREEAELHTSARRRQNALGLVAVAEAFLAGDPEERVTTILRALVDDPSQPHRLASLAHRLSGPVELGEREALYLSWLLRALAMEQAPDDEKLQQRLADEIAAVQAALKRLR